MKTKYRNNMKVEPERLPRKFPQGTRPGQKLWHLPDILKISDIFFNDNVRFNGCIQFFQIKEKSIFSASEGGK